MVTKDIVFLKSLGLTPTQWYLQKKFIENKDHIKTHINELCSKGPNYQISTGLYNMGVQVDYKTLKKYFENTCSKIK